MHVANNQKINLNLTAGYNSFQLRRISKEKKIMKNIRLLIAPALLLIACGKQPFEVKGEAVTYTEMAAGDLYGNGDEEIDAQNSAIYTAEAWANLLEKMNSINSVDDSFSVTDIDFETEMILILFDEIRGTNGFQIRVSKMMEFEDQVLVTVAKNEPTGEFSATVITQPFYIIKAAKTEKAIIFN
jgi:hypothetical protein